MYLFYTIQTYTPQYLNIILYKTNDTNFTILYFKLKQLSNLFSSQKCTHLATDFFSYELERPDNDLNKKMAYFWGSIKSLTKKG